VTFYGLTPSFWAITGGYRFQNHPSSKKHPLLSTFISQEPAIRYKLRKVIFFNLQQNKTSCFQEKISWRKLSATILNAGESS
jgi:hypothetical protein